MIPGHGFGPWWDTFCFTAFAAVAGWIGYLMRTVDNGGKILWFRSLLEAFSSGIIGFIVVLLCRALGLSYEWMGVISGVFGWLGAKVSIQLLENVVRKKLGLEYNRRASDVAGSPGADELGQKESGE